MDKDVYKKTTTFDAYNLMRKAHLEHCSESTYAKFQGKTATFSEVKAPRIN